MFTAQAVSYCKGVAIPTEFTVTMIPMLDSVRLQNKHGEETHPPYNFWIQLHNFAVQGK